MFPAEAAELVAAGLRADGVELRLDTETRSVHRNSDGSLTLALDGGDTVTVDKLLVSTGRHPALEGLGLDSVGLAASDGKPLTPHRLDRPGRRRHRGTTAARGCTRWATRRARPC